MKPDNWEQRARALGKTPAAYRRNSPEAGELIQVGLEIADMYVEREGPRRRNGSKRLSLRDKHPATFQYFLREPEEREKEREKKRDRQHPIVLSVLDTIVDCATFGGRLPWRQRKVRPGSDFDGWIERQWECAYQYWIWLRLKELEPRLRELVNGDDDRDPLLTALPLRDYANTSIPSAESEVLDDERRTVIFQAVEDNKAGALLLDLAEGIGLRQPEDTDASIRKKQRAVKAGKKRLQKRLADQVDKRPGRVKVATTEIAGRPYPWPDDYYHGPCHFLDPLADELGERIVIKTIEPEREPGWHRVYPLSQPKRRERRSARPNPLTFGYVGESRRGHGPDSDDWQYRLSDNVQNALSFDKD